VTSVSTGRQIKNSPIGNFSYQRADDIGSQRALAAALPRCSPSAAVIEDYRSPVEMERIRRVLLWFRQSEERWKEGGHKRLAERRANSQVAATGGDHEPG
jgi:hypothetical protein